MKALVAIQKAAITNDVKALKIAIRQAPEGGKTFLGSFNYAIREDFGFLPQKMRNACVEFDIGGGFGIVHVAAFYDSLDVFIYLLRSGLRIDAKSSGDFEPIHFAAIGRSTEVAMFICSQNSSSIHRAPGGFSAIYLSVWMRCSPIVRYLMDSGVDVNGGSFSSVQCAIANGDGACLALLVSRGMSSLRTVNGDMSPLMLAIANEYRDGIVLLLENGADSNYCTLDQKNAMSMACRMSDTGTVSLLLDYGFDVRRPYLESVSFLFFKVQFTGLLHLQILTY